MLRLTRTAIGLLTAQYRSVLKKCWAINVGVFGLMGKVAASVAKGAADTIGGTLNGYGINVIAYMLGLLDSLLNIKSNAFDEQSAKAPATELPFGAPTVAGTLSAFGVNVTDGFSVIQAFKRGVINSVLNGFGMGKSAPTVAGTLTAFGVNVTDGILLNLQSKKFVTLKALPAAVVMATIAATVPTEAQAVTAADLGTSDNITWTSVSGTGTNVITVNYPSTQYWRYTINESAYGTNYKNRTVNQNINTTNEYIAGGVYNYSSASTTNITNGLFYGNNVTYTNSSTSDIKGLIFYNSGNIGQFAADVVNNTSTYTDTNSSWKHAKGNFYNSGVIEAIIGDFINNSLRRETGFYWDFAEGGAMYLEGTVGSITGNFVGNSISSSSGYGAWGYGGALYLNGAIGDIKGNFISNKITVNSPGYSGQAHGGAIFIGGGTVNSIDGDFIDNSINFTGSGSHGAVTGGAIYNAGKIKDIKGKFQGNNMVLSSDHNYNAPSGGAALNNQSNIHHIVSDFVKNTTTLSAKVIWVAGRSYDVYGALFNGGVIDQIDGSFKDNIVTHSLTGTSSSDAATTPISSYGGGLANLGRATVNADFSGNQIRTTISGTIGKAYAYGGAIYNSSTLNVKDSSFTNNTATATGGATAVAQGGGLYNSGTATFTGYNNFANNRANGVLNDIYNSNGTITIAGTTTLNSGYNGDNNSSTSLTINDHATFNLNESNGEIHRNQNLGALTNNGTFNLSLDLKSDGTSDSFIVASTPSSNEIIVTAIKAIGTLTPGQTWTILSGSGASSTGAHLRKADQIIANPTITSTPIADAIMASTPWEENYYAVRWTEEGNILNMDLTPNKLGIIYRSQGGIAEVQRSSSLGDTLYLVNTDATNATKTFSTSDATKVYNATFTPGTTRGTVNIQGARSGDNISTIDLNGFEGFKVDSDATLNITDAKLINGAASSYGGAIYNDGTVGTLTADFSGNSAGQYGGAIYNANGGTIGVITGTYNGNYANWSTYGQGGAIANFGTINNLDGVYNGNYAKSNSSSTGHYAQGGVIFNGGTIGGTFEGANKGLSGTFENNYVAHTQASEASTNGGAIYNDSGTIYFAGESTFSNNKVIRGSSEILNDIYNNATITLHSGANVTLNSGYTGTDSASLNINSGATFNLNENNNELHNASTASGIQYLGNVTNNGTFNLGVDIKAGGTTGTYDQFNISSFTGNSIILRAINAMENIANNTTYANVISNGTLALPNGGTTDTLESRIRISDPIIKAVTEQTYWDDKFGESYQAKVITANVTLTSDKRGFIYNSGSQETKTVTDSLGDSLKLVNQNTDYATRSFNATNTAPDYTTTENLGNTYGTVNVNGLGLGASTLTIGSGFDGFNIGSGARVNLSGLTLSGGDAYAANLAGGTLGLTNVTANGAKITGSSGSLTMSGTNTIDGNLAYSGAKTIEESGTTTFNGTVNGFTNNGTVNVSADNITGAATNNGMLNLSSGTLENNISGSGTTQVAGGQSVTNNATISSALNNAGTLTNSATISGATTNTGTLDNNGTLSGTVNNSGTLMTAADALTGSSVTNNGTLELEGGNLTTSLLGTGRMKLMSGGVRLLATTPPATTGSLSFGSSDDYVNSILTSSSSISTSDTAIATGGYLDNNYYRKDKKSGILNGFKAGKIGNKNDDNFSKFRADNDNFVTVENKAA